MMVLHSLTNSNRRSRYTWWFGCSYDYIRGLRSRSMHRASNFSNIGKGTITIIVTIRRGHSNRKKGHSRLFNSIRISLVNTDLWPEYIYSGPVFNNNNFSLNNRIHFLAVGNPFRNQKCHMLWSFIFQFCIQHCPRFVLDWLELKDVQAVKDVQVKTQVFDLFTSSTNQKQASIVFNHSWE